MERSEQSSSQRFCWLRRCRHRFTDTTALRLVGHPFGMLGIPGGPGRVLRCRDCGREITALGERLERLLELGSRS